MFGYIRTAKPELRVREYELYKAVYCTLCRRLGRNYGILSRLTLSYDFTFLALLQSGLQDGCDSFEQKRCPFNPMKKCNFCRDASAMDLPAAAAMIMLYYKILDNIADERGFKRLGYRMLKPIFSRAHRKAAKNYPALETAVADYIAEQNELEAAGCTDLDRAADPTAKALSAILRFCSADETQCRVLDRLGYCLGRYIYLLDAACDLERDLKSDSYNVLKNGFSGEIKTYLSSRVVPQLYFCINEAGAAFELLDLKKYKPILGNIIYLGLEETLKKELNQ